MTSALEIQFSGWTATPRMPFIISGSEKGGSICLHTPTYSLILGVIGCCLGRLINSEEVKIGFHYSFDRVNKDMESRKRLQLKRGMLRPHEDGSNPYLLEFHSMPKLTLWLDRIDWESYFSSPIGTPSLGRSQDILKIESVKQVIVRSVKEAEISGCIIPFGPDLHAGGQLVQLAEAYRENEKVGTGRTPVRTRIFMSIPHDNKAKLKIDNLYITEGEHSKSFYLHVFKNEN